jgi:hypothetical protein
MNALTLASIVLGLGNTAALAQPRDTVRIDGARGSQVWIEGSSNLGGWRCRATAFDARVAVAAGQASPDDAMAAQLRSIVVRVAVRDLRCGNRKMDHDLYAALGASDPAQPAFIVAQFEVVADSATATEVATRGSLAVAGQLRPTAIGVAIDSAPDGVVHARGAVPLRMTDFGVTPPTGLFGLVRSRNEVTVRFDLAVSRRLTP